MRFILFAGKLLSSAFLILLVSFAYAQRATLNGTVKFGDVPLQGATLIMGNKSVVTDLKGEFSIDVPPGNYLLFVTHVGFSNTERFVAVDSGNVTFLEIKMKKEGTLEEVVVVGSRSFIPKASLGTPVPVDVISSKTLLNTAQVSLTQMLNFVAPSLNASRQLLNEPITLRGLDPQHVLILVNGTRYHNTAWLNNGNLRGQLGRGSVGNDLNSIPFSGVDKIEILRDGASAQYGSDAIAGVINIRLKDLPGKTSLNMHAGQFYSGDGLKVSLGFNRGVLFNKKGVLNYSGDFRFQAPTFRGGEYQGTVYKIPSGPDSLRIKTMDDSLISANGFSRKTPVSNVGINKVNSAGFLMNGRYPIEHFAELFWTGMVNYRKNIYQGAYRFPKNGNQVNTELHPNGFKAEINSGNWDATVVAGLRGRSKNNWRWEFNNGFGLNSVVYNVNNSNNASQKILLGKNAPTTFYAGTLTYGQLTNALNLVKDLSKEIGNVKSLSLALGAEMRYEYYQKEAGEEASWENYDVTGKTQAGSQGFFGFSPQNAVDVSRRVIGTYLDLETDIDGHMLIDVAGRYEYYNDFGGNLAGKLAARYKWSDKILVRASVGNGFRTPSMQQIFSSALQTAWTNVAGIRIPVIQGTFTSNSDVGMAFGLSPLEPEKSTNFSFGLTSKLSANLSFTIDAYRIDIRNRIVLSGVFKKIGNQDVATLLAGKDVDLVQFYVNAINSRTVGIDVAMIGNWTIKKTNLDFSLAANFNSNKLFGDIKTTSKLAASPSNSNALYGPEERTRLEHGQPGTKAILSATIKREKWRLTVRNSYFGQTENAFTNNIGGKDSVNKEHFSSKLVTDLSLSYSPVSWLEITLGANNIFNVYPDRLRNKDNTSEGILIYCNEASPFGFNGGYYFINTSFRF